MTFVENNNIDDIVDGCVDITKNKIGQPEQIITYGDETKHILNELDPEDDEEIMDDFDVVSRRNLGGRRGKYQAAGLSQLGDENLPDSHNESKEFSMSYKINETVQDHNGVSGDFMKKMGGKTDRLGAKQKNTGGSNEKFQDSSSGSSDDGIQTAVGKVNLIGARQKNTGGSNEEFGNSKAANAQDGIQNTYNNMAGDLGQNDKQKNKGGQHEPFKGSKNKMSENWDINNVAHIMEESDINIQMLFDNYARETNIVTTEEFEILAKAHGCALSFDNNILESMMKANKELIFYENEDESGRFWLTGPITETEGPFPGAAPQFGSKEDEEDGENNDDSEEDDGSKDKPIKERRFGGSDTNTYDPFSIDLDRAMHDSEYSPDPRDDEMARSPNDDEEYGDIEEPVIQTSKRSRHRSRPNFNRNKNSNQRYESKKKDGRTLVEMTGTSGVAAPPMSTAISRGTEINRTSPDVDVDDDMSTDADETIEVVEGFEQCGRCGGITDNQGCLACDLMRETHELGIDAPDPNTDSGGHFTSDATKSGFDGVDCTVKGAATKESGSAKPDDGITTEIVGMGSELGQNDKQKNKGGQHEPLKGGSARMQENIARMANSAKIAIQEGALSIKNNGNFAVRLVVHCDGIKTRKCRNLTEALVNIEELVQAYGHDSVQLEARFFNSSQKILAKKIIAIPELAGRGPVVCEGRCIFRYAEVANDFADQIVSEGIQCKIDRHNWGASVNGRYNWNSAKRAFENIPATQ